MVVPRGVQEVWQWPLGQGWPNKAESQQQDQSVGTQDGLFGLGWAEDGEQSFAGGVLIVVAYTEQCSPEYGVCYPGVCLDSSQGASGLFHPWTSVPLPGFFREGMDRVH